MPLGTKGNSVIVKDGKLAENCGCCLNCQDYVQNVLNRSSEITLSITSSDVFKQWSFTPRGYFAGSNCGPSSASFGLTAFFPGDSLSGTYSLSKISSTEWRYVFPASQYICNGTSITITRDFSTTNGYFLRLRFNAFGIVRYDLSSAASPAKESLSCNRVVAQCTIGISGSTVEQFTCAMNANDWILRCVAETLDLSVLSQCQGSLFFPAPSVPPPDLQAVVLCSYRSNGEARVCVANLQFL